MTELEACWPRDRKAVGAQWRRRGRASRVSCLHGPQVPVSNEGGAPPTPRRPGHIRLEPTMRFSVKLPPMLTSKLLPLLAVTLGQPLC